MDTFFIGCENIKTVQEFSDFISICSLDELKEIYGYIQRHSGRGFESEEQYKERRARLDSFLATIRDEIREKSEAKDRKATNNKGRQSRPFRESMVNDADNKRLSALHKLMENRIGKNAALVMICAKRLGWITDVTSTQVKDEFGHIGNVSGFNKYFNNPSLYDEDEIKGMETALIEALNSI